jgi:hypothetical protein
MKLVLALYAFVLLLTGASKSISICFDKFFYAGAAKHLQCIITNASDSTLWIMAYGKDTVKKEIYLYPVFDIEIKKEGTWADANPGFSGLGLHLEPVKPGEKFFFETTHFDTTAEALKIGIDIRNREQDRRPGREIWTEEIPIK